MDEESLVVPSLANTWCLDMGKPASPVFGVLRRRGRVGTAGSKILVSV